MLVFEGTGTIPLAIVANRETEKEAYTGSPLRGLPILWDAISKAEMDHVLRICLFAHGEHFDEKKVVERGAMALRLMKAKGIKVCMPIGTDPLRAISPLHGQARKLIGATIQTDGRPLIIPLETKQNGIRALRSFMWTQTLRRFVKRGKVLAQGGGRLFAWQPGFTGETAAVRDALQQMLDEKLPVGVDLETTGTSHVGTRITAIGLANKNVGISVPWESYTSRIYGPQPGLQDTGIHAFVRRILADDSLIKLLHNGQFDATVLRAQGIPFAGEMHDTLLGHRIAFSDLYHNLQFVASHEFAIDPWKTRFESFRTKVLQSRAKAAGLKAKDLVGDWAECEPTELMEYNLRDASILPHLWGRLEGRLKGGEYLWEQYLQMRQMAGLAAEMQFVGQRIDEKAAEVHRTAAEARMTEIEGRWNVLSGGLPLSGKGSKKAIEDFFFKTLGAPVVATSKATGQPSLKSAALLEYDNVGDDTLGEAAFTLYEYRKIKKSYDAFLKPLKGNRVYAVYNVAGTKGLRGSYSKPNLQQWAKAKSIFRLRTQQNVELAPNLRNLLIPDEGKEIFELDYAALELRLVAYSANIPEWLEWMRPGSPIDMHVEHVWRIFGKRLEKNEKGKWVDPKKYRDIIKTLTYARFYNSRKTVGQVLQALKPSMPDLTEKFLVQTFDKFDEIRPEIPQWQQDRIALVRELGYAETGLGHYRQYHDRRQPDANMLLSFSIQSTGGVLINAAMLRINRRIPGSLLVQVHDALLGQAFRDKIRAYGAIAKEEMERPVDLWGHKGVIFPVDGGRGPSWRDAKEKL